jgi:Ca2+-binding RTX toxin-like protein
VIFQGGNDMTIHYFTFSTFGAGVQWNVTAGTGVYVAEGSTVGSTDNFAITGTGLDVSVDIDGAIYGDLGGLSLTNTSSAVVRIGDHGQIGGDPGDSNAMSLDGFEGSVENRGKIRGYVGIDVLNASDSEISNYGSIIGASHGIDLQVGSSGAFTFLNFGRLDTATATGGFNAIYDSQGTASDVILNAGVINGTILLGDGNDFYYGGAAKPMDGGLVEILLAVGGGTNAKISAYVDAGDGDDLLFGSKFVDYLVGNKGRDTVTGGGGDDVIVGGLGKDSLVGGTGADEFAYQTVNDSHGNSVDIISDFSHKQHDRLSISAIDAKPGTADDDAFKFIGTDGFANRIGALRYTFENGHTVVQGNLDHDNQAEFEIVLNGEIHLQKSDFDL